MKKHLIALACLCAFAAHATEVPPPPKAPKAARATSTSSASTGAIGITANPSAYFEGTSAFGGSLNLAGARFGTQERSAPPVAVAAPQQPLTSCRLGFGVGGSNTSGGLGLNFVGGQDQICLVSAQLALMDRLGQFSDADRLMVACRVEGMAETSRCKSMKQEPALASYRDPNLLP